MKQLIMLITSAFLISACVPSAPSAEVIQTAIAQTQAADPTVTSVPTLSPTPSPTLAPSATPTSSPTATPDQRVIDVNPKKLVLTKADFPSDGQYFLPSGGSYGPVTNSEIVASWTVERGQEYLAKSGRIYGWETDFVRGSNNSITPDWVWNEIVLYKTSKSPKSVIKEDANCASFVGLKEVNVDFSFGDASIVCAQDRNGELYYLFEIAYRNLIIRIDATGSEVEMGIPFFQGLTKRQLEKIDAQTLSNEVTFTP